MTNFKNITTVQQLEKAINKIKPISITNIYSFDGYSNTHSNMLMMWKTETEKVTYVFNTQSEVTQEAIDLQVQLINATPLELLTALF